MVLGGDMAGKAIQAVDTARRAAASTFSFRGCRIRS